MNIRQFRYTDLEALIDIAQVSFAEEYMARGATPESFIRQVRMVTRGRMIPFTIVAALAGIKWEMFVAEVDGKVVGFGSYIGRKRMELTNLMVHPDYRQRGIGQGLLQKRLQRLSENDYPLVTTTILASNEASLGNVNKQGFEVFDSYSILETPLPLQLGLGETTADVVSRPIRPADREAFAALEERVTNPSYLAIHGSAASNYFLSFGGRLMNRFTGTQQWARTFSRNGTIIGFLAASTSHGQAKGSIARPLVADENLDALPLMLREAASWLSSEGKTAMQISVLDEREQLVAQLVQAGWVKCQSWLRLVKWLK